MKYLIIPGHLGKDAGAVAAAIDHIFPQEERYMNLQQAIGFMIAYATSSEKNLADVSLVIPKNSGGPESSNLFNVVVAPEYFSISDRYEIANNQGAALIELHNNAGTESANGCEALCYSQLNSKDVISNGYKLSDCICRSISSRMKIQNRGVKPIYDVHAKKFIGRELPVITKAKNTSIIVESGFISNKKEVSGLDVDLDGYNESIGACIWLGMLEFLKK